MTKPRQQSSNPSSVEWLDQRLLLLFLLLLFKSCQQEPMIRFQESQMLHSHWLLVVPFSGLNSIGSKFQFLQHPMYFTKDYSKAIE
jgi:hypothetical protein